MTAKPLRYVYENEAVEIVGCVDRHVSDDGKRFVQYRYERGGYLKGLKGARLPLYRLPDLRERIGRGERVFDVEGEKNAEALARALREERYGAAVTTIAGGANATFTAEHLEQLRGAAHIIVIADSDGPGRACAERNASAIAQAHSNADVRIVDLFPDRDDGSDVSDFLEERRTFDEFRAIIEAAPRFENASPLVLPHGRNGERKSASNGAHSNGGAKGRLQRDDDAPDGPVVVAEPEWDDSRPWPTLDLAALHGLAGDFVRKVAPHSEADLSALLAQFLCAFGCGVGASAFLPVESTRHTGRLNVLVVGDTAGGRKGTAKDRVDRVFRIADERWLESAHVSGLASGEGLINRLRDRDQGEPVEKRVLVIEPEFSRVLAAASRDGNTLGAIVRDAWDSGRLQNLTRKDPLIATGCHVGIIGHITADELRAKLSTTDIANGFLNRFIIVCARRRQKLPHGGNLSDADFAPIAKVLRTALDFGRQVERMRRSSEASVAWERFYEAVPQPEGLLGAVTARAEAQVLRLSIVYALLDGSSVIEVPHLRAAEALWKYAHSSAQHVFGSSLGDDVADRVLTGARDRYPESLDREQLRDLFSRHVTSERLSTAIEYLVRRGLVACERVKTDGRPRECIRAIPRAESVISAESYAAPNLSALSTLSAQSKQSETSALGEARL